jgi:threonyl-tRNA synthetase
VQVRLLTVSDRFNEYAERLVAELREHFVRAELDLSGDRINKKIRTVATDKVPCALIIGEREAADGTVTLRRYGVEQQITMPVADFEAKLLAAIRSRSRTWPEG